MRFKWNWRRLGGSGHSAARRFLGLVIVAGVVIALASLHLVVKAQDAARSNPAEHSGPRDHDAVELSDTQREMISVATATTREFPREREAVGNIDFNENVLQYRSQKTYRRKKGDTVIDLHPDLLSYLAELQQGTPAAPIFPVLSKKAVGSASGLSAGFRHIMNRAGILCSVTSAEGSKRVWKDKSFHSLRHTFCRQLSSGAKKARKTSLEVRNKS